MLNPVGVYKLYWNLEPTNKFTGKAGDISNFYWM
jgi:hypothetical protein